MKKLNTVFRAALLPSLIFGASQVAFGAQDKAPAAAGTTAHPTVSSSTAAANPHFLRATKLIGTNVHGADGKNVGEIKDLIVNLATGDVRYALFEYDPGIFKSEKVFAVPLQDLDMAADGKTVSYKSLSRDQLDRTGIDRKDWKGAMANNQYLDNLDRTYGYESDPSKVRMVRASDIVDMDVNSREGKDIGDIKELVLDMGAGKVRYAVLEFDPGWFKGEKLYAFPLSSFSARQDDDELMLNVDRAKLSSMKSIDPKNWDRMTDARSVPVNTIAARTP
jgi:sporulation protein YlmC with PRC-barrel domain